MSDINPASSFDPLIDRTHSLPGSVEPKAKTTGKKEAGYALPTVDTVITAKADAVLPLMKDKGDIVIGAGASIASGAVAVKVDEVKSADGLSQPVYAIVLPPDTITKAIQPADESIKTAEASRKEIAAAKPESTNNLWAMLNRILTSPMARTWAFLQRWTGKMMENVLAPVGRFLANWIEKANERVVKPIADAVGRSVSWTLQKGKAILDAVIIDLPRAIFNKISSWLGR